MFTLLRWQPLLEVEMLRRQVDEILSDIAPIAPEGKPTWQPRIALQETDDRFILQVQLPGVDAKSLDVQATRDQVTIAGDRPASPPTAGRILHSEFRYGPFQRTIHLPEAIQHQAIQAAYEQGILTLVLLKQSAEVDRVVKVDLSPAPSAS